MKRMQRGNVVSGLLVLVLMCIAGHGWAQPKASEVIKFSHKFHLTEAEAFCTDCHVKAESSTTADDNLLPTMEACANCHDVDDEEACTQCHRGDEDTWQALTLRQKDLQFNHKFHNALEELNCRRCHSNMSTVDYANGGSYPAMKVCANCHNNQRAPLVCANCHNNTLNLRPTDHSADFLITHKTRGRFGEEECAVCHATSDCSECHEGASLFSTGSDIQSPLYPTSTGTKGLTLARVHELNFRFTHPMQAQGRTSECAVCHEANNFCQTCHEAEGIDVAGKPLWHGGPDWGALAGVVGTGGGRHAQLAKRDIESCAACHSTSGDDPTCLLCHTDFDGVQGTNPRTHDAGFENRFGEGASFHNDAAALCFSCHTNTEQAGLGFCGYCHGPK